MCRMCEGFSLEDVLLLEAATIDEYGFTVVGVSDADESPGPLPWSYTVGLLDAIGHPELIVAGPAVDVAAGLLNRVGRRVLVGQRLAVGDRIRVAGGRARVGADHPVQYELHTFNVWHNLRSMGLLLMPELEALQVFAPPSWFCRCHQHVQPDLGDPLVRLGEGVA
jgi:hypothetical protein